VCFILVVYFFLVVWVVCGVVSYWWHVLLSAFFVVGRYSSLCEWVGIVVWKLAGGSDGYWFLSWDGGCALTRGVSLIWGVFGVSSVLSVLVSLV